MLKRLLALFLASLMLLSLLPAALADGDLPAEEVTEAMPEEVPAEEEDPAEFATICSNGSDPVTAPAIETVASGLPETEEGDPSFDMSTGYSRQSYIPGTGEQDTNELFFAYMRSRLNDTASPNKVWTAGDSLTGTTRNIYTKLIEFVPKVASGERSSTAFSFPAYEVYDSYTAEELGVSTLYTVNEDGNPEMTYEAWEAYQNKTAYDLVALINALLFDFPFELYWFDKSTETVAEGGWTELGYDYTKEDYILYSSGNFQIQFPVAEGYALSRYNFDTSVVDRVVNADDNAQKLIAKYAGKSDYEKLDGYRKEICNLVSYNWDAFEQLEAGTYTYGDPWQLIWVFDGDPDTNVVCEGYAKAFQYLCDLTEFQSNRIRCISVTGKIEHAETLGDHMWNIVRMENGNNYLIDITNCDSEMAGSPDRLFLRGASSPVFNSYMRVVIGNATIYYYYDQYTTNAFSESDLVLDAIDYSDTIQEPTPTPTVSPSATPSADPTATPSSSPSAAPSASPTPAPTMHPEHGLDITEAVFPDPLLRAWIVTNLPISGNEKEGFYMTEEQVQSVRSIDCSNQRLTNLQGMEFFTSLIELNCSNNGIASLAINDLPSLLHLNCSSNFMVSLDLGGLPNLVGLDCSDNRLCELDLSGTANLMSLTCSDNQLTSLDISGNTTLTNILCSRNQLTALDVSNQDALRSISCAQNQLTVLNLRNCPDLEQISCETNQIRELDFDNCLHLRNIVCRDNQLSSLLVGEKEELINFNCSNNLLQTLDVSICPNLGELNCESNRLTTLDLRNAHSLVWLYCENNQLTDLLIGNSPELEYICCSSNQISSLDVSACPKLSVLECLNNGLMSLNTDSNAALKRLNCDYNALQALNVGNNPLLTELYCRGNQLRTLDVSKNAELEWLICDFNSLVFLNLGQKERLVGLWCGGNRLESLDVGGCPLLRSFDCQRNRLRILDVSDHSDLELVWCSYNRLNSLNVNNCPSLKDIHCDCNELLSLDTGSNTELTNLSCVYNRLSSLDLHTNTALTYLFCHRNRLTSLDVSQNTELETLYCANNMIESLDVSSCKNLRGLECTFNRLSFLDLSQNQTLIIARNGDQTALAKHGTWYDAGMYQFDLTELVPKSEMNRVVLLSESGELDAASGIVTFPSAIEYFQYAFDTGFSGYESTPMNVTVKLQNVPYLLLNDIPDANFRAWMIENLPVQAIPEEDAGQSFNRQSRTKTSYFMSEEQVLSVREMDCSGAGIADLTGLRYFSELEWLNCSNNEIIRLDVQNNNKLQYLDCSDNVMEALDVSRNNQLLKLDCSENRIAELNVNYNTALIELNCAGNGLGELNLSSNAALEHLDCSGNDINTLDVSQNPELTQLDCANNHIQSLDLGENETLQRIEFEQTIPGQIGTKENGIYTFDLGALIGMENIQKVTVEGGALDSESGIVTFASEVESFVYRYDTGHGSMDVTVCLTFDEVAPAAPSYIMSNTANFVGRMTLIYYIVMNEDVLADPDAYVEITLNDEVTRFTVRNLETNVSNGVTRRKIEIPVKAPMMRDVLTLKLYDGKGNLLPLMYKDERDVTSGFEYRMIDYLRGRQQNSSNAEMVRLAYAAEWYGIAAQLYFDYHTDLLTQSEISALNAAIADGSIVTGLAQYAQAETGTLPAGVSKKSNTVMFESDNSLRTYFYTDNPDAYTFSKDGVEEKPRLAEEGKYYLVEQNIAAAHLSKQHTFTVTDGTDTYTVQISALGYCYGRAVNSSNRNMQNLAKALYLYGKAAQAYFGIAD